MGCMKDNANIKGIEKKTTLSFSYNINIHRRYHFQRVINHGAFGQVKMYSDRIFSGTEYAIKCISKAKVKQNQISQIRNEIDILSQLDHPNIVRYFCTVEDSKNYYIIMEYLSGKNLEKIFKEDYNKLTLDNIRLILYQIFSALSYIHSKNIVHRDIKPANIMCIKSNGKFDLKLIDFGLSNNLDSRGKTPVAGSLAYLAPEGLNEIISTKNDMWACGVILYWFIYNKMPFEKSSRQELYEAILKEDIEFDENMMRAHIPKDAIDLCKNLLNKNPDDRISAFEALCHSFFKNFNLIPDENNSILNEFYKREKIEYIRLYNLGNIVKKTFVFVYSMLSSYDEEEKFRQTFLVLLKDFNNEGTLNPREIFEEFKNRGLVTNDDAKTFSFVDPNKTRRVKRLISLKSLKQNQLLSQKELVAQDWGNIPYTTFICFCFIEEFLVNKKDCYKSRVKYIFQLMSNMEEIDKKIDEELKMYEEEIKKKKEEPEVIKEMLKKKERELIDKNEYFITRRSFKTFIYKYALPFLYEKDLIEKFFTENNHKISLEEFQKIIE